MLISLVKELEYGTVNDIGYCPIALYEDETSLYLAYVTPGDSEFAVTTIDSDLHTNPECMKCENKWGMIMHIRLFSRSQKMFALVGYESGDIGVWVVGRNGRLLNAVHAHNDPVMCLDIDTKSCQSISGSADDILQVLRLDDDLQLHYHFSRDSVTSGFACTCVRGDGSIVVCGGWDGKLRLFGWRKMKPLAILKFHAETVNAVSFSRDNLFAAGSKDGRITIWDVYKEYGNKK